jgi:hypothetical protein
MLHPQRLRPTPSTTTGIVVKSPMANNAQPAPFRTSRPNLFPINSPTLAHAGDGSGGKPGSITSGPGELGSGSGGQLGIAGGSRFGSGSGGGNVGSGGI